MTAIATIVIGAAIGYIIYRGIVFLMLLGTTDHLEEPHIEWITEEQKREWRKTTQRDSD